MNCKKCGKEISDDSIYCGYCGTQQAEDKPEPAVDATDEKNTDSTSNKSIENEPKKKSMQAVIIGITAAALVLALAIILVISVIFIPKILVGKTKETVAEESIVNDDATVTEDENLTAENVNENAKITVTIMAANETGAINGATVKLSGTGIEISAETDASGTAVFSDIAAGEYNIVCDAEGYHKNETIVNVSESDILPVVALVPEVTGDDAYVLLTWKGDHDLDLCAFNTEMKEYINIGHPIDSAGNVFLYADHGADLPYEVIYIHNASAEIAKTFYVADSGNARNGSSSQMEADGVTIRVYDSTGLVYENTADSSENAPLWCPCYYYAGTVYDQGDYIHDTTGEQYAWISFDEKDAYTAESSTSAASDAEWKHAYLEYIKTVTEKHWEEYSDLYEDVGYNDIFRFNLIYIDDDDIPELVVSAGSELLVSWHNGNLQKFSFCDDDFMNPPTGLYSGVTSYIEGEGSFIWTGGGHQGCYESVCTLNSSGFSE
ncbi:MAG: carboxypeptidase regulatory-like domain-containing protein, partial [Lachnospiraceae bacterium]|nr:carboxypeptidase regulatory-like domain-containing protein [Lachnospiraceae bacterium]